MSIFHFITTASIHKYYYEKSSFKNEVLEQLYENLRKKGEAKR